jgi:DNA polymerase II small subunit/DNA polymerase delta subunit B
MMSLNITADEKAAKQRAAEKLERDRKAEADRRQNERNEAERQAQISRQRDAEAMSARKSQEISQKTQESSQRREENSEKIQERVVERRVSDAADEEPQLIKPKKVCFCIILILLLNSIIMEII